MSSSRSSRRSGPVWRHFLEDLCDIATVTRYDERGYGLSDWDVDDLSLESRVADLESIVDDAGLQRFALMGMAQGGPVAIEYVTRHPEKVSRLVLYGSYAGLLRDPTPKERELNETYLAFIRVGWARPHATFRRVFTSLMIPGATEEQMRWVDALQRMSTSAHSSGKVAAVHGWYRLTATTTSCWPTNRRGRCSWVRSGDSSSTSAWTSVNSWHFRRRRQGRSPWSPAHRRASANNSRVNS